MNIKFVVQKIVSRKRVAKVADTEVAKSGLLQKTNIGI
jgi:hypothetical protein